MRAIALKTEAASTTETSVNFYQITRRVNPEDSHLHLIQHSEINVELNSYAQHGCVPYGSACLTAAAAV
jgi:hypothetical protein